MPSSWLLVAVVSLLGKGKFQDVLYLKSNRTKSDLKPTSIQPKQSYLPHLRVFTGRSNNVPLMPLFIAKTIGLS